MGLYFCQVDRYSILRYFFFNSPFYHFSVTKMCVAFLKAINTLTNSKFCHILLTLRYYWVQTYEEKGNRWCI